MNGIDRIAVENLRADLAASVSRQRALLAKVHAQGCRDVACQRKDDAHPSPACLLLRERIRVAFNGPQ
jgi:hypothetical protein